MKLFSTGCEKCKILEKKLEDKNIKFEIINDIEEIKKTGYNSAPLLEVDGKMLDFMKAIQYVNKNRESGD